MKFLELFQRQIKENPEKILLCDDEKPKGYTYEQIDCLTGKIASYLKKHHITKEDMVMICLPRSARTIISMFGVWKAGAAFVVVEDTYAPERIAYIKEDCSCKMVLDQSAWEELQNEEVISEWEVWDDKAAAFAVYTSGSTGAPKGVLHEYGQINTILDSYSVVNIDPEEDRFALSAPLNFVASLDIVVFAAAHGLRMYIVAYAILKNPRQFGLFYTKNKITITFLSPSYLAKVKQLPPYVRQIVIGSEPAANVYMEGITIYNCYAMSESAFAPTIHVVDQKRNPTPIGIPCFDLEYKLIDENGNSVPDGVEGEFIFRNPYARHYIHLEEQTAKAFKDGWYYSGDIARKNEEGELVICGRMSDMFKINGNRVEPGEIEAVARKVMGIEWAAVRGFVDAKQSYICVYYLDDKDVDFEVTRNAMSEFLPYYMLPSYFIHIDQIPLKVTGKMDRNALPKPKHADYMANYEAPRNELEQSLCDAFAKVLDLEKVGIKDDFYQIGGDSMASIEALQESGINGLTTADIFAGRTVEKIIQMYREKYPNGVEYDDDERDAMARKSEYPLTAFQTYMIDYQMYTPKSTMLNLFNMIQFDKSVYDPEKMADAVTKAIHNHPALLTKYYFNQDGSLVQKYDPEMFEPIEVEKIDQEAFDLLKDDLVTYFRILNSRLYRIRIFETEKSGYLFFDVHHTIFDGTSFQVFFGDIFKAYNDLPLEKDYYYLNLLEKAASEGTSRYEQSRVYFTEKYAEDDFVYLPTQDFTSRKNTLEHIDIPMQDCAAGVEQVIAKMDVSKNALFNLVTMLSVAIYDQYPKVQISWTYNGRDTLKKLNSVGLLLCDLPIAAHFTSESLIADLAKDMETQINDGIAHSEYNYTLQDAKCVMDDKVCFLYQEDIYDGGDLIDMEFEMMDVRQNRAASENLLDVELLDGSEGLILAMDYNACIYKQESIEKYGRIFKAVTESIAEMSDVANLSVKAVVESVNAKLALDLSMDWMD